MYLPKPFKNSGSALEFIIPEMDIIKNKIAEKTIYSWRKQVVSVDHNRISRDPSTSFLADMFR